MGAGYGSPSSRRRDLKDAAADIVKVAAEEKVDMILAGGDLFEHKYVSKSSIDFINALFKSIPHIKIFIVPGNHDPYVEGSYYRHYTWSGNVHILAGDSPYRVMEDLGVCVYGAGFSSFYQDHCLLSVLPPTRRGMINILLAHATVDLPGAISDNRYNPVSAEELGALGMDYIALGHYHNRIDNLAGINAYNPGSPEPLGFDEPGIHGFYLGRISPHTSGEIETGGFSIEVAFVPSAKRKYEIFDVSADGAHSDDDILKSILAKASARLPEVNILKAVVKGRTGKAGMEINTAYITDNLARSGAYSIFFQDETLPGYDMDSLSSGCDLRGSYTRSIIEMMNEGDAAVLRKALRYGLEALDKGSVDLFED